MIRGLWFFAQLVAVILAAVWLAEQKGAVSLQWRGWLVETSAGILILIIAIFALILIVLWRLWRILRGTPHAISRFRLRRKRSQGHAALVRSLSAIASGEGAVALRYASEAEEIGDPALAHLAAAEAAELAGDMDRAAAEYGRLRSRPDTALIGLRGLTQLMEWRGDITAAIELARQARKLAPKSPWAARQLFELERRSDAFAEAERTLNDAAKLGAFSQPESDRLMAQLLLARAVSADSAGKESDALSDVERAHQLDPGLIDAALLGVRLLARSGRAPAAERMLMQSWSVSPGPVLARAWMALAPAGDVTARLRQAERLHALDRDSVEGRLALAEAQLATGRWAEARSQLMVLDGLTAGNPAHNRYCGLMAYLESASGNESAARGWFEKSLAGDARAAGLRAVAA